MVGGINSARRLADRHEGYSIYNKSGRYGCSAATGHTLYLGQGACRSVYFNRLCSKVVQDGPQEIIKNDQVRVWRSIGAFC